MEIKVIKKKDTLIKANSDFIMIVLLIFIRYESNPKNSVFWLTMRDLDQVLFIAEFLRKD